MMRGARLAQAPTVPRRLLAAMVLALAAPAATAAGQTVWTQVGPYLRPVVALAADAGDHSTLYAGTRGRGVFRSADGGATWAAASAGLGDVTIGALAADAGRPGTVYAATAQGLLFRSEDGAVSWQRVALPVTEGSETTVGSLLPVVGAVYALGTGGGTGSARLLKSTDAGVSWSDITAFLPEVPCPPPDPFWPPPEPPCRPWPRSLAASPGGAVRLYLSTLGYGLLASGLLASDDGGSSWLAIAPAGPTLSDLRVHPADARTLFATVDWPARRLLRSVDGGVSWQPFSTDQRPGAELHYALDPRFPARAYLSARSSWSEQGSLLRTEDGGASWQEAGDGLDGFGVTALHVDPASPDNLFAATALGVARSTDRAASWQLSSAGIDEYYGTDVWGAVFDPTTPGVVFAESWQSGLWRSVDGGAHWRSISRSISSFAINALAARPVAPSLLVASIEGRGTVRSSDGGETWTPTMAPDAPSRVAEYSFDPLSPDTIYAAADGGVFKSTDGARTWVGASGGLPVVDGRRSIAAITTDPCKAGWVYAAMAGGGVYRTTDAGRSWTWASAGIRWPVRRLLAAPGCPTTLYAIGSEEGPFFSTDGAATWRTLGYPEDVDAEILAIDPAEPGTVHAATSRGLARLAPGFDCFGVYDDAWTAFLAFDPQVPGRLLASGRAGGIQVGTSLAPSPLDFCSWQPVLGWVGLPFVGRLVACGGAPPYAFQDLGGTLLAAGLTLARDRRVTGTPGTSGSVYALLRLTDAAGGEVVREQVFQLLEQIHASAVASPAQGDEPLTVELAASSSGGLGADSFRFDWDFGDGTGGALGARVVHTYQRRGTYVATVTVKDFLSPPATASVTITVKPPSCTVSCSASVAGKPCAGESMRFTATATARNCSEPPTYGWTFGDGAGAAGPVAIHTYAGSGQFHWTLAVAAGSTACSAEGTILVEEPICPDCWAMVPAATVVKQPVQLQASVTARRCPGPTLMRWSFGDGGESSEQSPTHAYGSTGTFGWRFEASVGGITCSRSGAIWVTGTTAASGGSCTGPFARVIPVAAHAPGLNSTSWQIDLDLMSYEPFAARVDIALLRANQANPAPTVATVAIPAGRLLRINDLLGALLPGSNGALGLRFCQGSPFVTSHFYTTSCAHGGVCGAYVPASREAQAVRRGNVGVLHQLSFSPDPRVGHRVDVGFTNASGVATDVVLRLYGDDGSLLGALTVALQPFEHRQLTRVHGLIGSPAVRAGWAAIEVVAPGAAVHAYALVIDNVSGDPTYVPAEPVP